MAETIYNPLRTIKFPSDIHGIRVKSGKEEIRVVCSDNEYHWVDFRRYCKDLKNGRYPKL